MLHAGIKYATITASSSGNTQVVAGTAGKRIRVLNVSLMANGSVNVKFQSNTTDKTGLYYLVANDGFILPEADNGWFETAITVDLNINLSGNVAVGGTLSYILIDAVS